MTKSEKQSQIREYNELSKIEPRLKALETRSFAVAKRHATRYQLNAFYDYCKPSICRLSGFDSDIESFRTMHNYDVVYQHILRVVTSAAYRRDVLEYRAK
jgi:hypothetical protein